FIRGTVFGVVQVQTDSFERETLTALGILGEKLPQMQLRNRLVVGSKRLPGGRFDRALFDLRLRVCSHSYTPFIAIRSVISEVVAPRKMGILCRAPNAFQACQTISCGSHQCRSRCNYVNGNPLHQIFEAAFSGEALPKPRLLQHAQNVQSDAT